MKVGRNDACPCGSGKKYKQCHGNAAAAQKADWSKIGIYVVGALLAIGLGGFVWGVVDVPEDGRVWSAEHGHWHNADGTELGRVATPTYVPPPPGPAPEGQVWSTEHGHWHDAVTGQAPTAE